MGLTGGGEVELPELVMPTVSMRMPMQAVASGSNINLKNVEGSVFAAGGINQNASSGPIQTSICTLDKGLYHLVGKIAGGVFGGLVPTFTQFMCANVILFNPQGSAGGILARIPFDAAGGVYQDSYEVTVFLTQAGWNLVITSSITTGVGQTIGAFSWNTVSRLL